MNPVTRPVWRTFDPRFEARAVEHVRAGGIAVVRGDPWRVLVPGDVEGALPELAAWALLDLGLRKLDAHPAAGVLATRLPARLRGDVADRCERDARCPTSVTTVLLDCRSCARCCRKNHVVLTDEDLARWHDAGRPELATGAFVRASPRGRRTLRVLPSGDCVHLAGNECTIYALRPDNCRAFPPGSEGCLAAREEVDPTP